MSTTSRWLAARTGAHGADGVVAAKTPQAAAAGAAVLAAAGNAVDAAVTAAFVSWVAEPWMSGAGGGGYLVVHRPDGADAVVEFPIIAPACATADMFALTGGASDGMFGWPAVVDDANIRGALSVGVPGAIAGLALALRRFGSISLAEALEPAIQLCEEGVPVTWHWSMEVARDEAVLAIDPEARSIFLDRAGRAPWAAFGVRGGPRFHNADLLTTLRMVADGGERTFYEGPIAQAIVDGLRTGGSPITESDLSDYEARITAPLRTSYHGHEVLLTDGPTGGATVAEILGILDGLDLRALGPDSDETLHLMAEAARIAFADRYLWLADEQAADVPLAGLRSTAYLAARRSGIERTATSEALAGTPTTLGARAPQVGTAPDDHPSGSTTHIGVMDRTGGAVSLTQTLVSLWGSGVVAPGTGVLLNNGMMWFDPRPGRQNSIAGGKRPLSNMAPALILRDGVAIASVGATGGRRIIGCVSQLISNLTDHAMSAADAVHAPRIDVSTPSLLVSDRLGASTIQGLEARGERPELCDEGLLEDQLASPVVVRRTADGSFEGGVDPWYHPATAVGVDPT